MTDPSDSDLRQTDELTNRILNFVEQQDQTVGVVGNALIGALAAFIADICICLPAAERERTVEQYADYVRKRTNTMLLSAPPEQTKQ